MIPVPAHRETNNLVRNSEAGVCHTEVDSRSENEKLEERNKIQRSSINISRKRIRDIRSGMLRNRSNQVKLTKQCVMAELVDKILLSVFENGGMSGLVKTFTDGLLPPSTRTIKRNVFQAQKKKLVKFKADMREARTVSLTFDFWPYAEGGYLVATLYLQQMSG